MNHKTMRRHQKYNLKLLKFAIDAQKSEDCCSRKLAIKNGSNPVFEPKSHRASRKIIDFVGKRRNCEAGDWFFAKKIGTSETCSDIGRGSRIWTHDTRFWRSCQIKNTVQIVPTVEPFVALGLLNLMPFDALLMLLKNLLCKTDAQLPKTTHLTLF